MKCSTCGNLVPDNDIFCGKCGSKVEGDESKHQVGQSRGGLESNKKKGKVFTFLLLMSLLILIGYSFVYDYVIGTRPDYTGISYSETTSLQTSEVINEGQSSTDISPIKDENKLDFQITRVSNLYGEFNIYFTVANNSSESIFVSPLDFTLSTESGQTWNFDISKVSFDSVTLQPGQYKSGHLRMGVSTGGGRYYLNYNGISDTQQIPLDIPASDTL